MNRKRNLKESASTLEVAIAKSLSGGLLLPSELEEVLRLTYADLMSEHGLDSLMAEKVVSHAKSEDQRIKSQSLSTWKASSRDLSGGYTRTHPMKESLDLDGHLEDIMDLSVSMPDHPSESDGRMLDYGHVKSDSSEGRMMRQALYEMSEYSRELHEMLSDDDDLPQWCHYKIAVARACVGKVKHYLEYKIKHPKQK